MSNNYLWIDTETTGLKSYKNDIIQIACVPVIDGKEQSPFNEFCQPIDYSTIQEEAIRVHGITIEKMKTFQSPTILLDKFINYIKSFNTKFIISGYNVNFDKDFIVAWFSKLNKSHLYQDLFDNNVYDVYRRAKVLKKQLNLKTIKLENLTKHFGVSLDCAHDALYDIRATIEIDRHLAIVLNDTNKPTVSETIVEYVGEIEPFPMLHLHSTYSFRDSINYIEDWVSFALENNIPAVAFPDHDLAASLYDSANYSSVISKINKKNKTSFTIDDCKNIPAISIILKISETCCPRLNLWAKNNKGYANLIKLASSGWNDVLKIDKKVEYPQVSLQEFSDFCSDLYIGSGDDLGLFCEISGVCVSYDVAIENVKIIKGYLKDKNSELIIELNCLNKTKYYDKEIGLRYYINNSPTGNLMRDINIIAAKVIDAMDIKYILSAGLCFIDEKDKVYQDIIMQSSYEDKRHDAEPRCVKSYQQYYNIIKTHLPDWVTKERISKAIKNSTDLVSNCETIAVDNSYHLPEIQIPAFIKRKTDDYDMQLYYLLMSKIKEHGRWIDSQEYIDRFKKELDVIWKNTTLNFIPYFLIYEDISRFARNKNIIQGLSRGCLTGDALVLTSEGYKRLDEIQIGDLVHSHLGILRKVTNTMKYPIKNEKLLEIKTNHSFNTIKMTKDHKVFGQTRSYTGCGTWSNMDNNPQWIEAKYLNINDGIWMPKTTNTFTDWEDIDLVKYIDSDNYTYDDQYIYKKTPLINHLSVRDISKNVKILKIKRYIRVDSEFVYMIGKWVRDGWYRKNNSETCSIGYAFSSNDEKEINKTKDFFEDFGFEVGIRKAKNKNLIQLYVYDKLLVNMFCSFFPEYKLTSDTKYFANFKYLPNNLSLSLLRGYGHAEEDYEKQCIDSTSISLILDVKEILLRFGIPSSISIREAFYKDQYLCKESYKINFCSLNISERLDKRTMAPVFEDGYYAIIENIKEVENIQYVYDITVEEDHSYLTQNFAVHNSAGGCIISYYLKITHIDPIKNKLPFERFLSHARINRGSFPDIDCDFGSRTEIIKYLKDKYNLGFAQLGTYQTFKIKNAIKDAMSALYGRNRNDPEINFVCKSVQDAPSGVNELDYLYGYIDNDGIEHQPYLEENEILANFLKQYPDIEKAMKKLLGLLRCLGRHASAYIISSLDLNTSRVPTVTLMDDNIGEIKVSQFEASMVESSGLIKADILIVSTLNTIKNTIDLIKERHNIDFLKDNDIGVSAIYRLRKDPAVFQDFYRCITDSSFQFNSDLVKSFLPQFAPESTEDLSILTALVRPGALDAPMFDTTATKYYVEVRSGARDVEYIHPDLKPILEETLGVFCFQEQIMEFLVDIVGYSLEESDQIRAAIGKKKKEVISSSFVRIREKCLERGWSDAQADTVCEQVLAFSGYSFNRSHSAAYSYLGYITMYLKHHYPLEWWVSELNSSSEDKISNYSILLRRILNRYSVNANANNFIINGSKIQIPISVIKGVGPNTVEEIIKHAPFKSIEDFLERVKASKVNIGHLIKLFKAKALDCFLDDNEPYIDSRISLLNKIKTIKSANIDPEVFTTNPIDIYFMEREFNIAHNIPLMMDSLISEKILKIWPSLEKINRKVTPYVVGSIPVAAEVRMLRHILKNNDWREEPIKIGFIGIFKSSSVKTGISKKTGNKWVRLDIEMSDGVENLFAIKWRIDKPLRFPVNSIVYLYGTLQEDWKGGPQLGLIEIKKIL